MPKGFLSHAEIEHLEVVWVYDPEQFQRLKHPAKAIAEQHAIELAEAMILLLMQAIDEQD